MERKNHSREAMMAAMERIKRNHKKLRYAKDKMDTLNKHSLRITLETMEDILAMIDKDENILSVYKWMLGEEE